MLCIVGIKHYFVVTMLHDITGDIEEALTKADPQGPLCDLLQMLLCALFSLQEEEAEEYQAQGVEGAPDEPEKKPSSSQTGQHCGLLCVCMF